MTRRCCELCYMRRAHAASSHGLATIRAPWQRTIVIVAARVACVRCAEGVAACGDRCEVGQSSVGCGMHHHHTARIAAISAVWLFGEAVAFAWSTAGAACSTLAAVTASCVRHPKRFGHCAREAMKGTHLRSAVIRREQ